MPDYFFNYLDEYGNFERGKWLELGKRHGREIAETDYPYAVRRERAEIEELADRQFLTWWSELRRAVPASLQTKLNQALTWFAHTTEHGDGKKSGKWSEATRLYEEAFIGSYLDTVAKKDSATRSKTTTPTANPTGVAVQGVTITMLKVERNGNEYIYTVRIDDPTLQYPIIRELDLDISKLQSWKGEYGTAFGDSVKGW